MAGKEGKGGFRVLGLGFSLDCGGRAARVLWERVLGKGVRV